MHLQLAHLMDKRFGNTSDDQRLIGVVFELEESTAPRYDWISELFGLVSTSPSAADFVFSSEALTAFIEHLEKTDYNDCLPGVYAGVCKLAPNRISTTSDEQLQEYGRQLVTGLLQNKWDKNGRHGVEADENSKTAANLGEILLRVVEARLNRPRLVS